ncbi:unnamed protein product [Coregonus sp. 'balchen']|nr:unnamed protein product [Coregonus sp. 'balchen']
MENEPSSPTRLLRNIQRQSAQLSQIVNSLMPPLNLSPSSSPISKDSWRWKGQTKRAFSREDQEAVSGEDPASLSSSLCPTCVSCDPLALCSDPACSSGSTLTSRTSRFRTHPVLSLPSDSLLSHHLQNSALLREDWVQRPLLPVKTESSHVYYHQSYRDRGHTSPSGFNEEDLLSQLSDPENSPEESLEDAVTPQTSHTHKQGPIRRRQGESVYNIDNIVIPMALAATTKVEKLQYKDIITPSSSPYTLSCSSLRPYSWRVVDNAPLEERERQEEEEEEELLCLAVGTMEQVFLNGTALSGVTPEGTPEGDTRGDMSTHVDWSCSHLDTDTDRALEEWVPRLPWDSRVFPLCEDEALRCHEEEQEEPRWEEREKADSTSSTDDSSSSVQSPPSSALSSALSLSSTTAPPAGYYENSTLTADSSHLK